MSRTHDGRCKGCFPWTLELLSQHYHPPSPSDCVSVPSFCFGLVDISTEWLAGVKGLDSEVATCCTHSLPPSLSLSLSLSLFHSLSLSLSFSSLLLFSVKRTCRGEGLQMALLGKFFERASRVSTWAFRWHSWPVLESTEPEAGTSSQLRANIWTAPT